MVVDLAAQWHWAILFGLFAGFSSALLGIGGGVVLMPLLVLAAGFGANMDGARGTALGYMVGTCLVGALSYHFVGKCDLNINIILLLTLGGCVGAVCGMAVGTRISPVWVKRVFALLMVYAAVRMFSGTLDGRDAAAEAPPDNEPQASASETP